jgi:hypothetical protein
MFPISSLLVCALAATPEPHLVPAATFQAIASEYSGEQAFETARRIVDQHRIQGSTMMARSAEMVLGELKAAGLEANLETFRSDGAIRYGTFVSPMGWEIKSGELWVTHVSGDANFKPFRMSRYADVPMSVTTYSKGGVFTGELIDAGKGTDEESYQNKNVAGKVVLAYGYAANVQREAVLKRGALGIIIYPRATDRPRYPDLIRYNGMWVHADEVAKASGGFQISANQYARLKELMSSGTVTIRGAIDATLGAGKLTLVHAWIRGTKEPEKEVVLLAHLDHPKWSANDNASGSGALVEAARTLAVLQKSGTIKKPARTIHFVWVPEFFGTAAWVSAHPEIRRCGAWDDPRPKPKKSLSASTCVLAGVNLDMVGEDTMKTDSTFYFTRMPDSVPSFLDALLTDLLAQTRSAQLFAETGTRHLWRAVIDPYTQGSDHDILLGLGIPATMVGHWPDWTHHSSEDRLDKVDASELLRSGVFAASAAQWIATAEKADWARVEALQRAGELSKWLARLPGSSPARTERIYRRAQLMAAELGKNSAAAADTPSGSGPRRLVLLPYDEALEELNAEERKFFDEAEERLGELDLELPPIVFETVNRMNGSRNSAELALYLGDQFGFEVDAPWVDRLLQILAARKLVALK